jgi:glycosyltransferase involved in cell wall biosynthesis
MTFSIIIPTYNRRAIVGEAIASVLSQPEAHRGEIEIVVVDDSTDDTLEVAARAVRLQPRCRLVTHKDPRRLGPTGAKNKGIELATGDVLVFLDSDDQLIPGSLSHISGFLGTHPKVDVLFGRIVNKSGRATRLREDFLSRFVSYDELIQADGVGEFLPVVRRKALSESGLRYAVEPEGSEGILWARLARAGYGVWYTPEVLRLYDDVGTDRHSGAAARLKHSRVIAKGHILALQEFGADLSRLNRRAYTRKIIKATIYNRVAHTMDPDADAYLRGLNRFAYGAARLVPRPLFRKAFEWSVWLKLAW